MSVQVKPVNILDTAYFEERIISIANSIKNDAGVVTVKKILRFMGFSPTNGPMHNKIAAILDANNLPRVRKKRRPQAVIGVVHAECDFRPFVTIVSPDR